MAEIVTHYVIPYASEVQTAAAWIMGSFMNIAVGHNQYKSTCHDQEHYRVGVQDESAGIVLSFPPSVHGLPEH